MSRLWWCQVRALSASSAGFWPTRMLGICRALSALHMIVIDRPKPMQGARAATGLTCLQLLNTASGAASLHNPSPRGALPAPRRSRSRAQQLTACPCAAAVAAVPAAAAGSSSRHCLSLTQRHGVATAVDYPSRRHLRSRQWQPAAAVAAAAVAEAGGGDPASRQQPSPLQRLGGFVGSNFIPCGLVLAIFVG